MRGGEGVHSAQSSGSNNSVGGFEPLLLSCARKLRELLANNVHLRLVSSGGVGSGSEDKADKAAAAPVSARSNVAATGVVWLLRCLCELAQAMGPVLASGVREGEGLEGEGEGQMQSGERVVSGCESSHSVSVKEGGRWRERCRAVLGVWGEIVDGVAQALCPGSVSTAGAAAAAAGCVPTLLAAEMATFLECTLRSGVGQPSMPGWQLVAGAMHSAGECVFCVR